MLSIKEAALLESSYKEYTDSGAVTAQPVKLESNFQVGVLPKTYHTSFMLQHLVYWSL